MFSAMLTYDKPKLIQLTKMVMPILILMVSACQQNKDDLNTYVANVKARPHSDIPAIPVMKQYEKFSYAASELRDPFIKTVTELPPAEETKVQTKFDNGIHPDSERSKEALESYPLSELVLVGTLEQKADGMWGLVRAPDGVIHRVQSGNYLGQNHGKVLAVTDIDLTLKEIISDNKGGYLERDASLSVMN